MILVFHASLAPRGYGRTSPRSPRVYLPFVANLAQLAVPQAPSRHGFEHERSFPRIAADELAPTPPDGDVFSGVKSIGGGSEASRSD